MAAELDAVASAAEATRAAQQAADKAAWELERVQNTLEKEGFDLDLSTINTDDELEAALKELTDLSPQSIREIVYKFRDAEETSAAVAAAEEDLVAAEASATQARLDLESEQSTVTTVIVVGTVLLVAVIAGAYLFVRSKASPASSGRDGAATNAVVAFENPMYSHAPPAPQQQHGGGGGSGAGFYSDVGPSGSTSGGGGGGGGGGYMDVAPTSGSGSGAATAGYVDVSPSATNDMDIDSEDEEV